MVDSCRSGSPWVDESVQTRKGKVNKNVRRDANIYIGDKRCVFISRADQANGSVWDIEWEDERHWNGKGLNFGWTISIWLELCCKNEGVVVDYTGRMM